MIIKTEHAPSLSDIEVTVRYPHSDTKVDRIVEMLKSIDIKIKCTDDNGDRLVNVSDIYYFESVDKKVFAYCERDVYKVEFSLYKAVEDFSHLGFVQINKSCILNINILDYMVALQNSRMEAVLKNEERVYVTRNFLSNIRRALQGGV